MTASPRPSWLSTSARRHLFLVLGLLFPLGLQLTAFKLIKLFALEPNIGLGKLLTVLKVDWTLLLLGGWVALIGLEQLSGKLQAVWKFLLHVVVLCGLLLSGIEQGFFKTTGSFLEAQVFLYGLNNVEMLSELLRSQLHLRNLLLLSLPFVFVSLPAFLLRVPRIKRWSESETAGQRRWLRLAPMVLLLAWVWPGVSLSDDSESLRQSTYTRLFSGVWSGLDKMSIKPGVPLFQARKVRIVKTKKSRPMNVVLILLESVRASATSIYNPKLKTTPFLAELAKKSLVVDRMFPVIPHTSKAVFSSHCGIYPKITMPIVEGLPGGIPGRCLPSLLRNKGYRTGFFQTATLTFERRKQLAKNMGFQVINGRETIPKGSFAKVNYFGWEDMAMLAPSMRFVDKAVKAGKPFFTSYLTLTPHHGYGTPPSFRTRRYVRGRWEFNQYLNAVRYLDGFLKKLFAEYKKRGLLKNTLFVMTGDHGEAFGEHKRKQHDNGLWDEIAHIPALVFNPTLFPKGGRIKGNRQQIDLLPTVLDALGWKIKDGYYAGKSLLKKVSPNRAVYLSCWYEQYCMAQVRGMKKVIYNYGRQAGKVYDLRKDPLERKNLRKSKSFSKKDWKKAVREMLQWRSTVNHSYDQHHRGLRDTVVSKKPFSVTSKTNVHLGVFAELVGIRKKQKYLDPNGALKLTCVFKAKRSIPEKWRLFFHLTPRYGNNNMRNLAHVPAKGLYPEVKWRAGDYVLDEFKHELENRYAPGTRLQLWVGMWAPRLGRQKIWGKDVPSWRISKRRYLIAEYTVLPKALQNIKLLSQKPFPVDHKLQARLGDYLEVVGIQKRPSRVYANGTLDFALVYKVLKPVPAEWSLFFHVKTKERRQYLNLDHVLGYGNIDPSKLKPGTYILDPIRRPLKYALHPGQTLELWIGMWSRKRGRLKITGSSATKSTVKSRAFRVFKAPLLAGSPPRIKTHKLFQKPTRKLMQKSIQKSLPAPTSRPASRPAKR